MHYRRNGGKKTFDVQKKEKKYKPERVRHASIVVLGLIRLRGNFFISTSINLDVN